MSRNKLQKFHKLKSMPHVIQPNVEDILNNKFVLKGNWAQKFNNNNPIILELGCGKGEYTVNLAKMHPQYNYIGIDIKGSRIYTGADIVEKENLKNVIFLRTHIEYLQNLFTINEVFEIWITFPDPQIKFHRRKKRLTHPLMLKKYNNILQQKGVVHLKTDSQFLYGYTLGVLESNNYKVIQSTSDLYNKYYSDKRLSIQTYYEKLFLDDNQPITYLAFSFLY